MLVRHGETEWSLSGRHTGRTDIPLTEAGRRRAEALAPRLRAWRFVRVLSSPLQRALDTCKLALPGATPELRADLMEWDYGDYEGLTTAEIRAQRPGWVLWDDGCPNGESAADVGRRADRVVAEVRSVEGPVALFAHGHLLRVLGTRWLDLAPRAGRLLALDPASISELGYEREQPVVQRWNQAAW